MRSANVNAVYNARIPHMRAPSSRFPRAACLFVLMLMRAPMILASDWRPPEEQLARKIAAATGPGAVALDLVNRSSVNRPDVEEIRRGLLTELAALGVRFVNADQAAATVQITLSENLQNYVWVAEIHQGNNDASVVMVATPRSSPAAIEHPASALVIHKTLLWIDESRILDVALVNSSPQHMIVLEPESVVLFKFQDGRWQQEESLPLSHSRPRPRDLRGRLALRKDHLFDAYLPGTFCRSTPTAPLAINCYESDDPWPLGTDQSGLSAFFTPTRNFFTGALSPGIEKQTTVKAFYSAAVLPRDKYKLWIFATVDGQVHLLDGVTDQTGGKLGWGSDIASVRSGCGLGGQVLVTSNIDNASETVTAFEIADREPVAVSQPAEFSGSITALWADSDGTGAIAVSQNSETGRYEAYRLSITCGQ
ncbi:MAG TPA: hypothetical protein VN948_22310 [Terriglobales bacterium]|nr:hypothetical protein [Terriglobales bacterium]